MQILETAAEAAELGQDLEDQIKILQEALEKTSDINELINEELSKLLDHKSIDITELVFDEDGNLIDTPVVLDGFGNTQVTDLASFLGQDSLILTTQIILSALLDRGASLTSFTQRFPTQAVPEPPTLLLLLGSGIAAISYWSAAPGAPHPVSGTAGIFLVAAVVILNAT